LLLLSSFLLNDLIRYYLMTPLAS